MLILKTILFILNICSSLKTRYFLDFLTTPWKNDEEYKEFFFKMEDGSKYYPQN